MADNNIGPKRLVVGAHYGLMDWLAQRITAIVMALYTAILLGAFSWAIISVMKDGQGYLHGNGSRLQPS